MAGCLKVDGLATMCASTTYDSKTLFAKITMLMDGYKSVNVNGNGYDFGIMKATEVRQLFVRISD